MRAQRGAGATKCARRNHCLGRRNTAVSRRAGRGDFVALGEDATGSADEQFEGNSFEPHADLRFPRKSADVILQRPCCRDRTARYQRSRY